MFNASAWVVRQPCCSCLHCYGGAVVIWDIIVYLNGTCNVGGAWISVTFMSYVYLYGLIYWLISGLLYESASGLA
jgi:hypothetical protein